MEKNCVWQRIAVRQSAPFHTRRSHSLLAGLLAGSRAVLLPVSRHNLVTLGGLGQLLEGFLVALEVCGRVAVPDLVLMLIPPTCEIEYQNICMKSRLIPIKCFEMIRKRSETTTLPSVVCSHAAKYQTEPVTDRNTL